MIQNDAQPICADAPKKSDFIGPLGVHFHRFDSMPYPAYYKNPFLIMIICKQLGFVL